MGRHPTPGPPRVVFLDLWDWDSFGSLAAAVRRRGMGVLRVAGRPVTRSARLSWPLDLLVFGPNQVLVDRPDDVLHDPVAATVVEPPTVDVQGPEHLVAALHRREDWPDHQVARRVPGDLDRPVLFDKLLMSQRARAAGIRVPDAWSDAPPDTFPIVVKGRTGSGGQSVRVAHDTDGLLDAVHELDPDGLDHLFYEELHPGSVVSYGAVARDGVVLAGAAYRALPPEGDPLGPSEAIEILDAPRLAADLARLLGSLRYSGFIGVDYLVDGEKVALIDVNPRVFAGWLALQEAGVPLLEAYLSLWGLADVPPPTSATPGRWFVRPIPHAAAEDWGQLRDHAVQVARGLRLARPVTGRPYVAATAIRALYRMARDVVRMTRRARVAGSPVEGNAS